MDQGHRRIAGQIMVALLRLAALALGLFLTLAPAWLTSMFAAGVGEMPEDGGEAAFYAPLLVAGVALGGGPLLIAIPGWVAGVKRPIAAGLAGAMIFMSAAFLAPFGLDGAVTRIYVPAMLALEALLFVVFVWPARAFRA